MQSKTCMHIYVYIYLYKYYLLVRLKSKGSTKQVVKTDKNIGLKIILLKSDTKNVQNDTN